MTLHQCKGWRLGLFVAVLGLAGCGADDTAVVAASPAMAKAQTVAAEQPATRPTEGPESTKGEMWEHIVSNAWRTADAYATARNPNAVFLPARPAEVEVEFLKQVVGEHQGRYLLKLVSTSAGNTNFAMLLPLFDEYTSSEGIDDEGDLWQVVAAKHNGMEF